MLGGDQITRCVVGKVSVWGHIPVRRKGGCSVFVCVLEEWGLCVCACVCVCVCQFLYMCQSACQNTHFCVVSLNTSVCVCVCVFAQVPRPQEKSKEQAEIASPL